MEMRKYSLLQLDQGFHRPFDGRYAIQAVDVVQVDTVDSQPLQALLTCREAMLRGTINRDRRVATLIWDHMAKLHFCQLRMTSPPPPLPPVRDPALGSYLSRQKNLVPFPRPRKPLPEQLLAVTVQVRAVPERGADCVRAVEELQACLVVVRGAVECGEAHGAETQSGD